MSRAGRCRSTLARLGYLTDSDGTRRVVHALIFTAVFSRHMIVWLCHRQTLEDVIAGCEAAWTFFCGVFAVVVPDNLSPVVVRADATAPRFTDAFIEYAQSRARHRPGAGFVARRTSHVSSGLCSTCAATSGLARRTSGTWRTRNAAPNGGVCRPPARASMAPSRARPEFF